MSTKSSAPKLKTKSHGGSRLGAGGTRGRKTRRKRRRAFTHRPTPTPDHKKARMRGNYRNRKEDKLTQSMT